MKSYLLLKYKVVQKEAHTLNQSVLRVLLSKIIRKFIESLILIIELTVLLFLFPILYLITIFFSKKEKAKYCYTIGLEHLINKTIWRGNLYSQKGYLSRYYVQHTWNAAEEYPKEFTIEIQKKSLVVNIFLFAKDIWNKPPEIIEVYFEGNLWFQYFALKLSKRMGIYTVAIERGIWYTLNEGNTNYFQRFPILNVIQNVDLVLYREFGTVELYAKYGVVHDRFYFDHNRIPVKSNPTFGNNHSLNEPKVLYLNSFKTFRKVDLLIQAIPLVVKEQPNVFFDIIGASSTEELEKYKRLAFDSMQISTKNLNIDHWAKNPAEYFDKAHLYILPATLIFCNNSLLEAMERGIPAVVTEADHVELLVKDGFNGFVSDYTPEFLAKSILKVIQNPELHKQMAQNSRKLIEEKYNDNNRLQVIFDRINNK